MPDPVDLLLQAFQDPTAYRRFIGRLRPKLVGRPHPKRRLARLTGSLIRNPVRPPERWPTEERPGQAQKRPARGTHP
jgi:hypothetical protein